MASRIEPNFRIAETPGGQADQSTSADGCIWAIIVVVGSYFVLKSIQRVTSGAGSKFDHYICYGTLIGLVVLMIVGAFQSSRQSLREKTAKDIWKRTAQTTELSIVNRMYSPGGSNDDGYEIHYFTPFFRLDLAVNVNQNPFASAGTFIVVYVSESLYKSLQDRNSVRIYFHPESPLTFLLEGE